MARPIPNKLLVEGDDEKRVIPYLVLARALDGRLPLGDRFVRWFMNLFDLPARTPPRV